MSSFDPIKKALGLGKGPGFGRLAKELAAELSPGGAGATLHAGRALVPVGDEASERAKAGRAARLFSKLSSPASSPLPWAKAGRRRRAQVRSTASSGGAGGVRVDAAALVGAALPRLVPKMGGGS